MASEPALVAAIGDVHGRWRLVAETLERAAADLGTNVDLVVQVGDGEALVDAQMVDLVTGPEKYRKVGEFPALVRGEFSLGAPCVFIGGNHDPWPALDQTGAGQWADGFEFLGRAGVREMLGLRVGYLSGIFAPSFTPTGSRKPRGRTPKSLGYYLEAELDVVRKHAAGYDGLDLLVLHDWPAGAGQVLGRKYGDEWTEALVKELQPTVTVCGYIHLAHTFNFTLPSLGEVYWIRLAPWRCARLATS